VLWTAAHHKIPLLNIMHNNRSYHEERMYIELFGAKFDRGLDRSDIGTAMTGPNIDYASVARGYGIICRRPDRGPAETRPRDQARH
jgi:acetolactate synthase I/II/III large subunit